MNSATRNGLAVVKYWTPCHWNKIMVAKID